MRSSGEKERRGFFTGPLPLRDVATNISLEAIQRHHVIQALYNDGEPLLADESDEHY